MTDSAAIDTSAIGEYFTIAQPFPVNLITVANDALPCEEAFAEEIPELFVMTSQLAQAEANSAPSHFDDPKLRQVLALINTQNQRLNIMLGYLLRHEDDASQRFDGVAYSGGGFRILSKQSFKLGQICRGKLFFRAEQLAIYCYAEVIAAEPTDAGQQQLTFAFRRLREEDLELLVRATLHEQSRQLKLRAEQRRHDQENPE